MHTMVEMIGPQYIMQIIIDNKINFKKARLQLMECKEVFQTPCAINYIDLIIKDIGELQ